MNVTSIKTNQGSSSVCAEWRRESVVALTSSPQKDNGGLPHPTILAACALLGIDARYEGQNFEVPVPLDGLDLMSEGSAVDGECTRRFRSAQAEVYGYDSPGRAIEIVNLRSKE